MKNFYFILLLLSGFAQAQIINIPDANFKAALLNGNAASSDGLYFSPDLNFDGEIELSEAALVDGITIEGSNILSVEGIQSFLNLEYLNCMNNPITDLPISGLTLLKGLFCDNTNITGLDLSNLQNVELFTCSNTQLTSLDLTGMLALTACFAGNNSQLVSLTALGLPITDYIAFDNCPQLETINCSGSAALVDVSLSGSPNVKNLNLSGCTMFTDFSVNPDGFTQLETLDFSDSGVTTLWIYGADNALENINLNNCPGLTNLILSGSKFTTIDLSGAPNINYLWITGGLLSSLDATGFNNPIFVNVEGNQLTSITVDENVTELDCSDNALTTLDLSQATALDMLDCDNNPLAYLNIKNGHIESTLSLNSFPLEYICADEAQVPTVEGLVPATVVVSPYCTFVPGGEYNTITGNARFDADFNGCTALDSSAAYVRIHATNGTTNLTTYTSGDGNYQLYTGLGNYTLTPQLENNAFYITNPVSAAINFASVGNTTAQDFCIQPNGSQPDLEVILVPLNQTVAGFNANYKIVYRNKGNVILSGAVQYNFDDATADFVSATPTPDNQATGLLGWNFGNLHPFETRSLQFTLNLNGPTETPPLNNGALLTGTATIDLNENELSPADNTSTLTQTVVASYDPNNKTCLEGEFLTPDKIGQYLHYNINFENIGTADAITVVVRDTINTAQFNIDSLQLLYASHPAYTRINGNTVEFIFENINLPSAIVNPIGGHGNVLFKIKTLPTLNVGDVVTNTANIYFDYNHPVETNEARTTFATLKRQEFTDASITVYPNPTDGKINIGAKNNLVSVAVFDVQGRILQVIPASGLQSQVDLTHQSNGIYFLRITTEKGNKIEKIIKQ